MTYSVLEISRWFQDNPDLVYNFVGVTDENELIVEPKDGQAYLGGEEVFSKEEGFTSRAKNRFPELLKITFVVKPSLSQINDLLQDLNKITKPKSNLLNIEDF